MKQFLTLLLFIVAALSTKAQQPKDWAQYGRYTEQNAKMEQSPEVVFMGNSITDFWTNHDKNFFLNNNFADRGISGQTTCEMLARFRQDVIALKPKVVVILAGINDIAQNNGAISLENITGNIISMCELARQNKIAVVLCSVLPCNHFSWRPEIKPAPIVMELNAMLKAYAANNKIPYADYHTALANRQGGMPTEFSDDGCHPNTYCYTLMEPIVIKEIAKAAGRKEKNYYTTQVINNN